MKKKKNWLLLLTQTLRKEEKGREDGEGSGGEREGVGGMEREKEVERETLGSRNHVILTITCFCPAVYSF